MSETPVEESKYTIREAAEVLRIHPKTLYKAVDTGAIRCIRVGVRKILIPKSAIEEYLTRSNQKENAPC